jgi:hypothetical protein
MAAEAVHGGYRHPAVQLAQGHTMGAPAATY